MLAFHAVISAYGFWLPNDPRGSNSTFVGAKELYRGFGRARTAQGRTSVAGRPHDEAKRLAAKQSLTRRPVVFTGEQARAIGRGFAQAIAESGYRVLACAVLPEHVHLVIAASSRPPRQVVGHLKGRATRELEREGRHPFQRERADDRSLPSCWAEGARIVYLDTPADVARCVRYVEENPIKDGKPKQRWSFVATWEG